MDVSKAKKIRDAAKEKLESYEQRLSEIESRAEALRSRYRGELATGPGKPVNREELVKLKSEQEVLADEKAVLIEELGPVRGELKTASTQLSAAVSRSLNDDRDKAQAKLEKLAGEFLAIVDSFEERREERYRESGCKSNGTPSISTEPFLGLRRFVTEGTSPRVSKILRAAAVRSR